MTNGLNFFQHWYPISPITDIDPQRPTPITLLGIRLVIWRPRNSEFFRVFLDKCPHRLAPLSEGRVDEKTGNLMCSYHGWQFDAQGVCTRIPQAENQEIVAQNRKNFCVVSLPVRQESDLLWVWPDADSPEKADTTSLPLSPQIDANLGFAWSSYVRDLPYDWDILVENLVDPSHVPFAHHGIQGNREKARAVPINMIKSQPDLIQGVMEKSLNTKITFVPPTLVEYGIKLGDSGKQFGLVFYCIPVAPGKSRIVGLFPQNFAKIVLRLQPRWWNHINERNQVTNGDTIILHRQEISLQEQKQFHQSWKTAYKLPTSADRFVIEFRNWFDKYCHGQLPWSEVEVSIPDNRSIEENRSVLLDVYQQHTQHCRSCRNTLRTIEIAQIILLAYFAITLSGVAILPDELRVKLGFPLVITTLLGLATYGILRFWLTPKFYFVDYIHPQK
jgi:phenylpropionate dioxygenase-like ring-hydroxylating dioxygenase large terminal subunit